MRTDASRPTRPQFLRLPDVKTATGRSKSEIYRLVQADTFPPSHRQSHKVAVWYAHEVEAWLNWRMAVDAGKRISSWRDCLPADGLAA